MHNGGVENGNLKATYRQLEECGIAQRYVLKAIREAEFLGLVRCQHGGRFGMTKQPHLFTLTYYFQYTAFFSRLLLLIAFVLNAGITWIWHIVFHQIERRLLRRDPPSFPTLIVGVTRESKELIRKLNAKRNPLKPVAVLDARGAKEAEIDGVPVQGKLDKLESILEEEKITHLIQCSDLEQSLNLLSACRNRGIAYILLPSVLGIVERDEQVESLEGLPVTVVSQKRPWTRFFG